jgi:tripartite-type tricarboxylate transporter receptor subunit TctC
MVSRRELLKFTAALPLAQGAAGGAQAQGAWPTRTITVVVPFPPGGTADIAARPLAAHLAEKLGRNVVVENKGGAGGGIGHAYVARAEPDGYTIMTALPSLAVIPEANRLQGKPPTYEIDQFVPLARMFADPVLLAVKKSSPWKTLEDFVTAVRTNPGQIPYGTSGYLGTVHLAMEMFLTAAGLKMVHVPYQGGGPSFAAFLARIDRQRPIRRRQSARAGAIWRRTPSELCRRTDVAGSRISRCRVHPVGWRVRAKENSGRCDAHPA